VGVRVEILIQEKGSTRRKTCPKGRAMAQAVSRLPPTAEARVRSRLVHVGFVVDNGFSPSISVFPCQFHYTGAPLHGKTKKLIIFIFFTGLRNKPQGCCVSVASVVGPCPIVAYRKLVPNLPRNCQCNTVRSGRIPTVKC
jgi:hypothetical protein